VLLQTGQRIKKRKESGVARYASTGQKIHKSGDSKCELSGLGTRSSKIMYEAREIDPMKRFNGSI
jgi:hypothetical protein